MINQLPGFSIIVPTHGRPEAVRSCLGSLSRLDYPRHLFEIVVVDDGGPGCLDDTIDAYRQELDVSLVRQEHRGPATARNTGAGRSRYEFLAFTDDDCEPTPSWLAALAREFSRKPTAVLGGRTVNALPENVFSSASQRLISYLYEYYNRDPERSSFFTSNNMAMSAEVFGAIGGFDTSYPRAAAEDRELCDHLSQSGLALRYVPSAVVNHAHDLSLRSFFRQHVHYGRGACCFHQVKTRRGGGPVPVEPWTFYRDLVLYPLRGSRGLESRAWVESSLLMLSQVAAACGYISERVAQDRNGAPASRVSDRGGR